MFVTGPDVVKTVTHEDVDFEELGRRARPQRRRSGVAHFAADDEADASTLIRRLLAYLPSNNLDDPPRVESVDDPRPLDDELDASVPDDPTQALRHARRDPPRRRRRRLLGGARAFRAEHHRRLRAARAAARSASWPSSRACWPACSTSTRRTRRRASCASATASTSRWSRSWTCPGFLPGVGQEHGGIIRHGAKLLYAYCEATVPKITVITRKAYGGAYDVMSSKHVRGDMNFAWPTAEIAVMGVEGAVNIIFKDRMAKRRRSGGRARATGGRVRGALRQSVRRRRARLRRRRDPAVGDARPDRRALELLAGKRDNVPPKKHGNIPL